MNAGFEQAAGDFAMRFGRDGEANRIDAAQQSAPVAGPFDVAFRRDWTGRALSQVANGNKIRQAFRSQIRMDARVLAAEMADADDCGA